MPWRGRHRGCSGRGGARVAVAHVPRGRRTTKLGLRRCCFAYLRYGQDLTANAAKLDPVIGRDDEIRRMVRVLCRRTKNNPVLIGEPGVGKTACVEGLAQRIARGDVPETLRGCQLVSLDMGALIAGAKYRWVAAWGGTGGHRGQGDTGPVWGKAQVAAATRRPTCLGAQSLASLRPCPPICN